MKKLCIVVDTTSTITKEECSEYDIVSIPLSVIVDGKAYLDQEEMGMEQLVQYLKDGAELSTSQPNIGVLQERFEALQKQGYDGYLVYTISSQLSGTYQAFLWVKDQLNLKNFHIVDSLGVACPIKEAAIHARKMFQEGISLEEIIQHSNELFARCLTFVYPSSLQQLKKGGRISPLAANMASLLKIKPLLYVKEDGSCIEKYGMARTENKLFDMMIEAYQKQGFDPKREKFFLLHIEAMDLVVTLRQRLIEVFGEEVEIEIRDVPAVLATHVGLRVVALQSSLKRA